MGLIGGLGGGVDRRLGAWVGDVEAGGGIRTGRWGLAWAGELGRWNWSAVRELGGELRDEGDEGGRRELERKRKFTGELRAREKTNDRQIEGRGRPAS